MKDWRREWLYLQTHKPSFFERPKLTPLVRVPSGYYRTKKTDNIWRESQRKKVKFMQRHTPSRRSGIEKVAKLVHKAFFGKEE